MLDKVVDAHRVSELERLAALEAYGILHTPPEEVFDAVIELAAALCDMPIAFISFVAGDRQWFKAALGLGDLRETLRDIAFCDHTIQTPDLLEVADTKLDARFRANPLVTSTPGLRFYAGVPLTTPEGYHIGTVCVADRTPRELDATQRMVLRQLAGVVMRMMEARKSERRVARLGEMLDRSHNEIYVFDVATMHCEYASAEAQQNSGYSMAELSGMPLEQLQPELDPASFREAIQPLMTGARGLVELESHCVRKNGTSYPVDVRLQLWRDGGRPLFMLVVADTSVRKRHEEMLHIQKSAMEGAMDGMAILDGEARFVYLNNAHAKLFGYSEPAELLGSTWRVLYTQQEVERIVKEVLPLLDCVGHWAGEAIALRRDGTTFDESLSLTRLPSGGLICVCRDITAGKRARRAAALLASVVEHSDDAIITKDLNGVVTSWNAAAQRLFGYQEQEMLGRPIQVLIPEDLMDEERRILERLRGGETISHYATKRRCKDGSLVDMSLTVSPIRDDDGKVIGASKIARDISAQKAMEAALYREKELAQVTLSSIGDAVITTDRDAKITYLNPIAQSMTGWSNDEAVGMPLPLVFRVIEASTGLPTRDPVLVALAQNRIVGLATDSLLINRHGAQTAVEDSAAPIHDRDGQIIGAVLIFRDVSETRAMALRMAHLAQHDALTDLPNRVLLRDRIEQSTALARRHQHRCALLFIDLDHFKLVNDSLGHSAADYILVEVGRRLREAVRESDTVSRQGGDEFVVLLGEVAHPNDAAHVATKILRSCAPPFMIDGQELIIGASVGIAVFPDDGPDVDALLRNADAAMYHAKQQGRNNFQFYSPGMNVRARERLTLKSELRRALSNGEFTLHYQPRVDVHTQAILGCEALIRWCHPDRGLVGPNEFIPAIEENGLIVPIGQWVMRAACRQLRDWRLAGASIVPVSINVSAAQFRRIDFYADLYQALVETHIEPQFLEIELTESTVMHDADATARVLHDLKNLGIRVSIDDFGTGYSSLSQLRRFPIDTLKIDQSFVQDLTTDPDDAAITGAIVNMAKSLRQQVVAEGVETIEQLNFLRALGCDQAQGYFFYRPLPAEAFSQLLLPRQRDASPTAS